MSIVLDALNKAEKERHSQPTKIHEVKIQEVRVFYKKVLVFVFLGNVMLVCFLLAGFILKNKNISLSHFFDSGSSAPLAPEPSEKLPKAELPSMKAEAAKQEKKKTMASPIPENLDQYIITRNHLSITGGPELNISGVFVDKNKGCILIGSETLGINDSLYGMRIVDITLKQVTFEYKGRIYVVPT
jgi:hypothetical protein